ncbi:HDOD domain-containing protein [Colwellia sp. KU-HH00111]|uniref:HDOD domain-containing protein n=1 Tax=Colwellia sp. KU-HH00111 TaxID=3127652 RepID=UPI00310C832F
MAAENALYVILKEKIKQDELVLPMLPEVALKVRQAADDPDISLAHMGELISHDPALSLGIIKVANSALLGRRVKVETISQAVNRIGLRQIKSIATAMAIQQVFVSKNSIVATYMKKSWQKTVDVASVAISLMDLYLKQQKHSPLSIDTLTLAAIVHNVGVLPIITEAEHHPDVFANPRFIKQAIIKLSGKIGGSITRAWGFSDELTLLAESWSDLTLLPKEPHYLDFIRAGAIYHGIFNDESTKEVLLASFAKKGILPEVDFMQCQQFKEKYLEVKSMFV